MDPSKRPPNLPELAAFARLCLNAGILAPEAVIAWADSVILESAPIEEWMIEISLARPHELDDAPRHAPKPEDPDLPARMLLGLVRPALLACERSSEAIAARGSFFDRIHWMFEDRPNPYPSRHLA